MGLTAKTFPSSFWNRASDGRFFGMQLVDQPDEAKTCWWWDKGNFSISGSEFLEYEIWIVRCGVVGIWNAQDYGVCQKMTKKCWCDPYGALLGKFYSVGTRTSLNTLMRDPGFTLWYGLFS